MIYSVIYYYLLYYYYYYYYFIIIIILLLLFLAELNPSLSPSSSLKDQNTDVSTC